jgi:iron complex transport system substrate-binding protein
MNTVNANHSRRQILAKMGQGAGVLVTLPLALSMAHAQTAPSGKTVAVAHAKGEIQVPFKPVRVLVFELAALDTLQTLGGEVRGVPEFRMPPLLARYADAKYARIGSLFEPDYEAIKALSPDLIIVGGRSEAKSRELSRFAPVLDLSVSDQHQMADIYRNIRTLGAIYGLQDRAEAEVKGLEQAVEANPIPVCSPQLLATAQAYRLAAAARRPRRWPSSAARSRPSTAWARSRWTSWRNTSRPWRWA